MEALNRYGRQELIEGWDQNKLTNSKIGIVGSGHIAAFLASSLVSLGVGDVRIYDDKRIDHTLSRTPYHEREFLLSRLRDGTSKVESLEKRLRLINPLVNVYGLHFSLDKFSKNLIEKPDLMIVATNDESTISDYDKMLKKDNIPSYLVQSYANHAFFKLREYSETREDILKDQDPVNSEVISGLLAGEILQKIMYNNNVPSLDYSPTGSRFGLNNPEIKKGDLQNKTAFVVGAGALGNFLCLGLAHSNIGRMYIVDDDDIEATNLNRQIMFYDSVGNKKAEVLSERLSEFNPKPENHSLVKRVDENFESELLKIKPDIIIDCVDNLSTRAILNYFAIRNNIPFISGGTDHAAGQVAVYEPGKSQCLDCRLGVNKALVEARISRSCINAPTPSVVVTNHIIGGLMASEARAVLDSQNYGEPVRKMIKYDSTKKARVGLIGSGEVCSCEAKYSPKTWIKKIMEGR